MSLKKHSVLFLATNTVAIFISFISGIFLTRILGPQGRGILTKVETAMALLGQILTLKVNYGIIHFVANKKIQLNAVKGIGILMWIISTILAALCILLAKPLHLSLFLFPADVQNVVWLSVVAVIIFWLTQGQIIVQSFLVGVRDFNEVIFNQLATSIFRLLLLVVAYLIGKRLQFQYSIGNGISMHLAALAFSLLMSYIFFWRKFKGNTKYKPDYENEVKPFFTYTMASFIAILAGFMNNRLDVWFVDYFKGSVELGFYSLAVNLGAMVIFIPNTFNGLLLPYLANGKEKENLHTVTMISKINFVFNAGISLILLITAPYFIPWFYGHSWIKSVSPFRFIILGIFFTGISTVFSAYNYATGKPKYNMYANMIGLVFTLVLDLVLIPRYGILGAAIASFVAYFVTAVLIFISAIYMQKLPLKNYFIPNAEDLTHGWKIITNRIKRIRR